MKQEPRTQNAEPRRIASIARDVSKMCSNGQDNPIETPLIRMRDEFHDERSITIPLTELKSQPGLKAQVKTTCTQNVQFITTLLLVSCYDFVDLVSCRFARTDF